MIDNKYKHSDSYWYKKSWTLKFRWCSGKKDLHYYIFSDVNKNGHVSQEESLIDPLTNKQIYSPISCNDNIKRANYVLLSKYYDIKNIKISCNNTTSFGQISFLNNGSAYSKFKKDEDINKYIIKKTCTITLIDSNKNKEYIYIEGNTGVVY